MPAKSKHACYSVGCNVLTVNTYCDVHHAEKELAKAERRAKADKRRGSAHSRGYGRKHGKQRAKLLRRVPFCEAHAANGIIVEATIFHHIDGDQYNRDESNEMGLCKMCHEVMHGRMAGTIDWFEALSALKGYDVVRKARGKRGESEEYCNCYSQGEAVALVGH